MDACGRQLLSLNISFCLYNSWRPYHASLDGWVGLYLMNCHASQSRSYSCSCPCFFPWFVCRAICIAVSFLLRLLMLSPHFTHVCFPFMVRSFLVFAVFGVACFLFSADVHSFSCHHHVMHALVLVWRSVSTALASGPRCHFVWCRVRVHVPVRRSFLGSAAAWP